MEKGGPLVTSIAGKVALITGSTRGIGLAVALKLKQAGCTVVVNGRCEKTLAAATRKLGRITHLMLMSPIETKPISWFLMSSTSWISGYSDLQCWKWGIRSAGETYDEWQRVFAVNLWSTTNCVEQLRSI